MLRRLSRFVFDAEPVATVAVIEAVLGVAVAFGLDLTAKQTGAIVAVAAAVLGVVARQRVTPAVRAVDQAKQAALSVARDITPVTAGAAGTVTEEATGVIGHAVEAATGTLATIRKRL